MQWTQQRQTANSTNLCRKGKDIYTENALIYSWICSCDSQNTITRKELTRDIYMLKQGLKPVLILFSINPDFWTLAISVPPATEVARGHKNSTSFDPDAKVSGRNEKNDGQRYRAISFTTLKSGVHHRCSAHVFYGIQATYHDWFNAAVALRSKFDDERNTWLLD